MKVVRMVPLSNSGSGKVAAFFDMQTDDEIVIKGFRLVSGDNGLFISAPNDKGKDGKYYESVILPKKMKSSLEKLAVEEYNNRQK